MEFTVVTQVCMCVVMRGVAGEEAVICSCRLSCAPWLYFLQTDAQETSCIYYIVKVFVLGAQSRHELWSRSLCGFTYCQSGLSWSQDQAGGERGGRRRSDGGSSAWCWRPQSEEVEPRSERAKKELAHRRNSRGTVITERPESWYHQGFWRSLAIGFNQTGGS